VCRLSRLCRRLLSIIVGTVIGQGVQARQPVSDELIDITLPYLPAVVAGQEEPLAVYDAHLREHFAKLAE
jgi:hypothetical protein